MMNHAQTNPAPNQPQRQRGRWFYRIVRRVMLWIQSEANDFTYAADMFHCSEMRRGGMEYERVAEMRLGYRLRWLAEQMRIADERAAVKPNVPSEPRR